MGVRGLFSFIHSNSDTFMTSHYLHSTQVIFDANNLIHYLYNSCSGLNAAFGGNYDTIAAHFFAFCLLLKSCDIRPIMVFDGGLDLDDRKKRTRRKRMACRLKAGLSCSPDKQGRLEVFPILCRDVFMKACKEQAFSVVQCDYEADDEIASLARSLNCPVISNDSDFVIFGVPFIPLQTLSFTSSTISHNNEEKCALGCKLFVIDNFLKKFGRLPRTHLPLLGILLGNDYVTTETFQTLLTSMSIPKDNRLSDIHRKIKAVMMWLQNKNLEVAVAKILETVKLQSRSEVQNIIQRNIDVYVQEPKLILSILENSENTVEVMSKKNNTLPHWFVSEYRRNEFPAWVLEVICTHTVRYFPQVEDPNQNYSSLVALEVLRGIVAIMLTVDYPEVELNEVENEDMIELEFVSRIGWKLVSSRLSFSEGSSSAVPLLKDLPSLKMEERLDFFHRVLEVSDAEVGAVNLFPPETQVFFLSLVFWAKKSNTKLEHFDALLLMVVVFGCFADEIGRVRSLEKTKRLLLHCKATEGQDYNSMKISELWKKMDRGDCLRMNEHILGLYQLNQKTIDPSKFEREIVHMFAEFQTVFFFAQILNRLLFLPYPESDMDLRYNGLFSYNAVQYMVSDKKWFENLKRKCEAPAAFALMNKIFSVFESVRTDLESETNVIKKRRKKKKSVREIIVSRIDNEDSSENDVVDVVAIGTKTVDLLGNRFAALLL